MQFTTLVACLGAMVASTSASSTWASGPPTYESATPSAPPAYGSSSAAPVSSSAPAGYASSSVVAPVSFSSAPASSLIPLSSSSAPYPISSTPAGYSSGAPAPTGAWPAPPSNGTYTHGGGLTTSSSTASWPSQTYGVPPSTGGAGRIASSALGLLLAGGIALVSPDNFPSRSCSNSHHRPCNGKGNRCCWPADEG